RITMVAGAALYVVGLGTMAAAQGVFALVISGGLIGIDFLFMATFTAMSGGLVGIAFSCTATSLAMSSCVRAVSEERRSMTLGLISAAGSLGTVVVPIATQALLGREPWQVVLLAFALLGIAMLPAAFWSGSADQIPAHGTASTSMREVLSAAM